MESPPRWVKLTDVETFPAFFPLAGKRVVIAGTGEPAEAKARLFAGSPAALVRLEGEAAFDPAAYAGADLVFVASFDRVFADRAAGAARACGAPLNVVDRPELSDFHTPAIVDRGAVVAAIGTTGVAPVLASLLRSELEARLSPGLAPLSELLGERRAAIRAAFPDLALRRAFFRSVLSTGMTEAAQRSRSEAAARLDAAIGHGAPPGGRVSFVLAPGDADLISVRAVRALATADVIVAEPSSAMVERHARRDAERRSPDEAPPAWIVAAAREGVNLAVVGPAPSAGLLEDLGDMAVVLPSAPGA